MASEYLDLKLLLSLNYTKHKKDIFPRRLVLDVEDCASHNFPWFWTLIIHLIYIHAIFAST